MQATPAAPRGASLETALILIELLQHIPRRRFSTAAQLCSALQGAGFQRDLRSVRGLLEQLCAQCPSDRSDSATSLPTARYETLTECA